LWGWAQAKKVRVWGGKTAAFRHSSERNVYMGKGWIKKRGSLRGFPSTRSTNKRKLNVFAVHSLAAHQKGVRLKSV